MTNIAHRLSLKSNALARQQMAHAQSISSFREVVNTLTEKYRCFPEGESVWDGEPEDDAPDYNLKIPPWVCQPYYRKLHFTNYHNENEP